ncbi:MAG: phage tail tube protein [Armatimonadota bacterium]
MGEKVAAFGTQLKYVTSSSIVGSLTKVGGVKMSSDQQECTTHDSTGGFKEYIPTLLEPGSVAIEGYMAPADVGQVEILAHYKARENRDMQIDFPDGTSGAFGSNWTFSASISDFEYGEADVNGILSFKATLRISGQPTFTPVV